MSDPFTPDEPDDYRYGHPEGGAEEAKAEKISQIQLEIIRGNFLTAFQTPQGEAVLAWMYDRYRAGLSTYVRGDPYGTAYNEGRRSVLLEIQGMLRMDDEALFQIARNRARRGVGT